jgi:hypothetical protein
MEKLVELFKNNKFTWIFSSFLGIVALIFLLREKPEEIDNNSELEEMKEKLKQADKNLRTIKKKNKELEEKTNGRQISDTSGNGRKKRADESREEGKGKTEEGLDELDDELNDEVQP